MSFLSLLGKTLRHPQRSFPPAQRGQRDVQSKEGTWNEGEQRGSALNICREVWECVYSS